LFCEHHNPSSSSSCSRRITRGLGALRHFRMPQAPRTLDAVPGLGSCSCSCPHPVGERRHLSPSLAISRQISPDLVRSRQISSAPCAIGLCPPNHSSLRYRHLWKAPVEGTWACTQSDTEAREQRARPQGTKARASRANTPERINHPRGHAGSRASLTTVASTAPRRLCMRGGLHDMCSIATVVTTATVAVATATTSAATRFSDTPGNREPHQRPLC